MTGTLTYAELSTILAALRYWQGASENYEKPALGFPHFDDVAPLNDDEINSLCERLNCGEIVSVTGGPQV